MKPFQFQNFTINQSKDVFRVGTDGVLLGALTDVSNSQNILEVGTGTGLISLMLAQRNSKAKITAIDINDAAVELSAENFKASPFSERLKAVNSDFKNFSANQKFDLIVSNPPYFEENPSAKDVLARQKLELDFSDLIKKSSELISAAGILSVIIPFESGGDFENICRKNQFHLIRKIKIKGIEGSKTKRLILEFSKTSKPSTETELIIEKSPRQYSDQYLKLTKDFHVFGK